MSQIYFYEIGKFSVLTPLPSLPKIGYFLKDVKLIWKQLPELTKLLSVVVEAGKPQFCPHYLKLKKSFLFSFCKKLARGSD